MTELIKDLLMALILILCIIVAVGISSLAYWVWKSEKSRSE